VVAGVQVFHGQGNFRATQNRFNHRTGEHQNHQHRFRSETISPQLDSAQDSTVYDQRPAPPPRCSGNAGGVKKEESRQPNNKYYNISFLFNIHSTMAQGQPRRYPPVREIGFSPIVVFFS
jgi:hypothetical protein